MQLSLSFPKVIIVAAVVTSFNIWADQPAATHKADIKPPLSKDGIDEEQMRLAKVIHKRIIDRQQKEQKKPSQDKQPLTAYKETLKSGTEFEMLPVKGGTFTWKGEKEDDKLEVTLSPFWMGKAEVTWEQYDPFMYAEITRQKDGQLPDFIRGQMKDDFIILARPTPPHHPMTFGMARDGHPAVGMTQHAANKYCQWISYQTGHFYRLPTEAEWEYACRTGKDQKYGWGDDTSDADKYAWFGGDAGSHYQKPAQKKPNAWGFHDMHGNVLEWTLDQFVANRRAYFGKTKVTDPWIKATKPYPHVTKGGHWKQKIEELSASARQQSSAVWKAIDPQDPKSQWYHTSTPWLGMRVVRPAKTPTAEEMYHYWNSGVEKDE